MNRIRLLPEQVANQIAAGEVVERPASVVKELVENALDAGATRITVEIQAGGRSLVRVTDDGQGMNRDDALLCLERHATSKIRLAEDLACIASMGFRGEALPSIASVSRFALTTRERESDSPEGTHVLVHGGKIIEVKAAGSAPGTSVEVRQIFYNLPARRKFLRSEETESAHVQHYVTLAALAFPEVAFTYLKDGRTVWQLPGVARGDDPGSRSAALKERLRGLWGGELRLLPVEHTARVRLADSDSDAAGEPAEAGSRLSDLRVWGFIGAPGLSRSTREDQHLFVNRRPIEHRGLNHALLEGYHTALMKGRYPVCCLFLELEPTLVDVNIHPAKREVRFHREREVRHAVTAAVRNALLAFHAASSRSVEQATVRAAAPQAEATPKGVAVEPPLPLLNLPPRQPTVGAPVPPEPKPLPMGFGGGKGKTQSPTANRPFETAPRRDAAHGDRDLPSSPVPSASPNLPSAIGNLASSAPVPLLCVPLRLVGVIGRLYVVLESDRGLVLLDQHAAHERILYEQMLGRMEGEGRAPSQSLLLPETLELSPRDAAFLRPLLPLLTRLGVSLSEFGERTFLLDALPPFVKAPDARQFALELVDELKSVGEGVNPMRLGEAVVAKTVCRHAVKAHDPLAGKELENLIDDLRRCEMPYTCPHGRPTLIEMNWRELEKKFGRSQ
ncbi:MAG: DNA mismatch repair endonuclease MutL [Verrucomicrobia bacterium]|nr:DNA mismatch repair endonuclease MutL [Verrucomicrobiota bacterium]